MSLTGFICVGAAHWDVLGRVPCRLRPGFDSPGSVWRVPGGVALNVARSLGALGAKPQLWSQVGDDGEGRELIAAIEDAGLPVEGILTIEGSRTDCCMFILDEEGSVTGVSDCRLLEEQCGSLLQKVASAHCLNSASKPVLIVDGNLPAEVLTGLSRPEFENVPLRLVVASDGKAARAMQVAGRARTTIHLNLAEAAIVAQRSFRDALDAAGHLVAMGLERAIVTDSRGIVADGNGDAIVSAESGRSGRAVSIIGAGDRLTAAHLVAESRGLSRQEALEFAIRKAQEFVEGTAA